MKVKLLVVATILLSMIQMSFAEEPDIGTVINKVLETDIEAYIDGNQIPSFNIDGYTALIVEDLRHYGFDVVWHPVNRTLVVTKNKLKLIEPLEIKTAGEILVGKEIKDVLYTDIKTYFNYREVKSYNIDGQTAVLINDLSSFGFVYWHEDERQITLSSFNKEVIGVNNQDDYSFKINRVSTIELELENIDQSYYFDDKEVGYLGKQAMISLDFLVEQFGYSLINENNHITVKKDNYSFKIDNQLKVVELFYDGQLVKTVDFLIKPNVLNQDIYLGDVDMTYLFGLEKTWEPDKGSINLSYFNDVIEEYGVYSINGTKFKVNTLLDTWMEYECYISNKTNITHGYTSGSYDSINNNYTFNSFSELEGGNNEIDITVSNQGKIMMFKTLHDIEPDYKSHIFENEHSVSAFARIMMSHSIDGYNETSDIQFPISGDIYGVMGNILNVTIEKLDITSDKFSIVDTIEVDINDGYFNDSILFSNNSGLYRIKGNATVSYLHGLTGSSDFFEFYVFYDDQN